MKKRTNPKQPTIKVGNVSDISGNVNIAGGDITTHLTTTGMSAAEIQGLFEQLYTAIEANTKTSPADKEGLKAEVEEIQSTVTEAVQKNEKVEESFLSRRFRNIARVAPDLLDVIVATLASPLQGWASLSRRSHRRQKRIQNKGVVYSPGNGRYCRKSNLLAVKRSDILPSICCSSFILYYFSLHGL